MIKKLSIILLCIILILSFPMIKVYPYSFIDNKLTFLTDEASDKPDYNICMKQDLLVLMLAYPEFVTDISSENDNVYLVMKSGKKFIYDDKRIKLQKKNWKTLICKICLNKFIL